MFLVGDSHIVVSIDGFGDGSGFATQSLVELTLPVHSTAGFIGFVFAKVISFVHQTLRSSGSVLVQGSLSEVSFVV